MNPRIVRGDDGALRPRRATGRSRSARLRGFQGNYGCFVRSYAYIRSLGAEGLQRRVARPRCSTPTTCSRALRELGVADKLPLAFGELCMHEFVLSGAPMKRELRITHARPGQAPARPRLPPADGLLPAAGRRGAAGRADRDRDARDARRLRRGGRRRSSREAREDPEIARNAPYTTPVRRLDEAARGQAPGHPPAAVAGCESRASEARRPAFAGCSSRGRSNADARSPASAGTRCAAGDVALAQSQREAGLGESLSGAGAEHGDDDPRLARAQRRAAPTRPSALQNPRSACRSAARRRRSAGRCPSGPPAVRVLLEERLAHLRRRPSPWRSAWRARRSRGPSGTHLGRAHRLVALVARGDEHARRAARRSRR